MTEKRTYLRKKMCRFVVGSKLTFSLKSCVLRAHKCWKVKSCTCSLPTFEYSTDCTCCGFEHLRFFNISIIIVFYIILCSEVVIFLLLFFVGASGKSLLFPRKNLDSVHSLRVGSPWLSTYICTCATQFLSILWPFSWVSFTRRRNVVLRYMLCYIKRTLFPWQKLSQPVFQQ
jgi:hypothetical protein